MSSTQSRESPERSATPTGSPDQPTTDVETQKETISSEPPSWSPSRSDKSDGSIDSVDIPQNLVSLDIETDENHADCVGLLSELRRSMWCVSLPLAYVTQRDDVQEEYERLARYWKKAKDGLSDWVPPSRAKDLARLSRLYEEDHRVCLSLAQQLSRIPVNAFVRRRQIRRELRKLMLKNRAYRKAARSIGPERAAEIGDRYDSPEDDEGIEGFTTKETGILRVKCGTCGTNHLAFPDGEHNIDQIVKKAAGKNPSPPVSRAILASIRQEETKRRSEYEFTIPTSYFRLIPRDEATDGGNKLFEALRLMERRRRNRKKLEILKTRLSRTVLEWSPALRLGGGRHRSARVLDKDLTSSVKEGKVRIPVRCKDGKLVGYLEQPWDRMRTFPQGFRVGSSKNASKPWDPSPLREEVRFSPSPSPEASSPECATPESASPGSDSSEASGGDAEDAPETHDGNESGGMSFSELIAATQTGIIM